MMLRSTSTASQFGEGITIRDLWEANTVKLAEKFPAYDGGDGFDHSSADASLMSHLAFWTGKDMPRMDRMFRMSGLMRDKYEKRADYRRDTIQKAARLCKRVYDWQKPETAPQFASNIAERKSRFFSAADLERRAVQERQWLVPKLVPGKTVTLLSGDGGTGKSLVALQLAIAVSTGSEWLGMKVQSGNVVVISAEDDEDEIHRRMSDILRALGKGFHDCSNLTLRSLAGEDALLAVEAENVLKPSPLFNELEQCAQENEPALIVIDTLADVFPSNENDRAKARQFIGITRGLAMRNNCAVIILAHPSLTGLNSGTGTSGSTAWSNSVRSRLYLSRNLDKDYEADTRRRTLSVKKQNYGETGLEIAMTWEAGVFRSETNTGESGLASAEAKAERIFLELLRTITDQGRTVNPTSGTNYAPKQFAEHPENQGITKRAFKAAMERLFLSRKIKIKIKIGENGPPSKRTKYIEEISQFCGDVGSSCQTAATIPLPLPSIPQFPIPSIPPTPPVQFGVLPPPYNPP
jgi:RecA-family ATPase